jgi:hypothetical protein
VKRSLAVALSIGALCALIIGWRAMHSPAQPEAAAAISARSTSTLSALPAMARSSTPAASPGVSINQPGDRPRFVTAPTTAQRRAAESDVVLQNAQRGLREYRQAFHQNPVGTNAEITRVLLGKNPRTVRYLPADAKMSSRGELIDQWEQPIFFHQISAAVTEIRSAGPDHVMWTADDEALR